MSKAFAYERNGQDVKIRVLVPEGSKRYNPAEHFQWFETSDYLEAVLKGVPYATFKTDDPEELESILVNGFPYQDEVWRSFFAYWKDQVGHVFLAPEYAEIHDLRDVGIHTHMKSPADSMKVGKYANRTLAALPKKLYGGVDPTWGDEVGWSEEFQTAVVIVEAQEGSDLSKLDRTLSILYVDLDSMTPDEAGMVDGSLAFSDRAVRALGLTNEPAIGQAWRVTVATQRGLGKGHAMYKPGMEVDIIIYGPKKIQRTERFFFGSMGMLHTGHPHTDRQAFVNFDYHRPEMGIELAKNFMREVVKKSYNEAAFRKLLLTHMNDMPETDQEGWILRFALTHGVSFQRFPGLFRRCVRYLLKKVMACSTRARIPMESDTYSIAKYAYVLPDPDAVDSEGKVDLKKSSIPDGCIVFPDLKPGTRVAVYRQPSENSNAFMFLTVIEGSPAFRRFEGKGICLLGRGAKKVLGRLGGGDMDDLFVIVHDPVWVRGFETVTHYPETEKITGEPDDDSAGLFSQDASELARFTDELLADIRDRNEDHYTNKHVHWQLEMAKNARASIGPVVNYGMLDKLLSDPDQRQSILDDIDLGDEDGVAGWEWLDTREPYQAANIMTHLELVIDAAVKDSTLINQLGDVAGTIRKFHKECKVYPASMESRIPDSKVKAGGYVLARSLTCKALFQISALADRVNQILTEREWAIVAPADDALLPRNEREKELRVRIRGEWNVIRTEMGTSYERVDSGPSLLDIWSNGFREAAAKNIPMDVAYTAICNRIAKELEGEDEDYMERLSVHLYYELYKRFADSPKVDEVTGNLRNYPDGLLWSPVFAKHFINALRKARVTGYYVGANLRPEFRRRLSEMSIEVELRGHNLFIQGANDLFDIWVGYVAVSNRIANALTGKKFRMDGGIIEFRRPQDICLPVDPNLMAQKPLTRLFTPKPKVEQSIKPTVAPKGLLGKVLKAALDVLK